MFTSVSMTVKVARSTRKIPPLLLVPMAIWVPSGEMAEHFNEYLLIRGEEVVDRVPTYRGLGHCFLG